MENKIIFNELSSDKPQDINLSKSAEINDRNIFNQRLGFESGNAKFPDWDIIPPSQFINPRIKQM